MTAICLRSPEKSKACSLSLRCSPILEAPAPRVGVAPAVPCFPVMREQHSGAGWPQPPRRQPTSPALPPLAWRHARLSQGTSRPVRTESRVCRLWALVQRCSPRIGAVQAVPAVSDIRAIDSGILVYIYGRLGWFHISCRNEAFILSKLLHKKRHQVSCGPVIVSGLRQKAEVTFV